MGLFTNPLGYAGYPPGASAPATVVNSTVRAATAAEAATGTLTNCYISPATADSATALDFASPPVLGYGSTTPRPVAATTLSATGNSTIGTSGATVNVVGSTNAASTTDIKAGALDVTYSNTGINSNGTYTGTTVNATTYTTNVAAAELSISGTTINATGSNAAVDLDITTKGAGAVIYSQGKAGGDQNIQITNTDNTAANSRAGLQVAVGGGTSLGDPYVNFLVSGAGQFTMGIDNSDSDNFKLSASAALGTSDVVTVTSAGALTTAAGITATTGNIQATNGNLVLNTAGNKIVSTSVGSGTAAGANSFGTTTLTAGTATVSTSAVKTGSLVVLWRQSIGATGANPVGLLYVANIVDSTSFEIHAGTTASVTTDVATDVSVVGWMIIN